MSENYGVLLDHGTGMPKWQVYYGSSKPGGEGWQRVAGALPDKAQTSAKWYRPYGIARAEKKPAPAAQRSEPDKKPAGFWDKIRAVRDFVRDEVVRYKPKQTTARVKSVYKVGDRVLLRDGSVGYIQAVLADDKYSVFDTSSGQFADLSQIDILHSEKVPPAQFAVGDIVMTRDGSLAGVTAVNDRGQIKVDAPSGKSEWMYPEMLRHAGQESEKDLKALDKSLPTFHAGYPERAVVGSLLRALQNTRSTTTLAELMDDLAVVGNKVPRQSVNSALLALQTQYPNFRYDSAREVIDISNGKEGLKKIADAIGASVPSGPYGWSPKPGNGVFSAPGIEFRLPAGTTVKSGKENAEVTAEITHGIIVAHEGGAAVLEVTDSGGASYKVRTTELHREDGRSFWKVATTPDGKPIKPDPFDPALYGDVVRDNFWLLRDREACRSVEPGDMIKSLPFAMANADGEYTADQVAGRVLDRMVDSGLLRIQFEDGRVLDVSPRMVSLSRDVGSMSDIHHLSTVRRSAVYGSTFTLPSGTRIAFGNPEVGAEDMRLPREGDEVDFQAVVPGRLFGTNRVAGRGKIIEVTRIKNKVRYTVDYDGTKITDLSAKDLSVVGRGGMPVLSSTIKIAYQSRRHFERAHPELFIKGAEAGFFTKLFGGGTSSSDMFETEEPPYVPNQAFMRTFMHLFPAADAMSARAYRDESSKEFVVEIGPEKTVGRAFNMSEVLPKVFANVAPGSGAIRVDQYEMKHPKGNRIDVTSDGNSLYVRIGDKLDQNLSALDALRPANAKTTKLYHAVTASKRRAYELLGKSDPALFHAISRFTYDPAGKRFVADLSDYSEKGSVLSGLRKLFGENVAIHESTDRTWWYPAGKGSVARLADDRASVLNQIIKAKHNAELPPIPNFGHRDGFELFGVQKEVVNFITAPGQDTVLLANDQGTGKTPIITASLMKWAAEGSVKRALVVVPASIIGNWKEEVEAWTGKTPEFAAKNLNILMGGKRKEGYGKLHGKNPPLITVVSYDTLLRDYKELSAIPWDAIALDEAQNIKNVGTKRERVLKKVFDSAPKRIAATGTAIENDPSDLFSIMEFLSPDTFGSMDKFNNDFIEFDDVKHVDSSGTERITTVPVGVKNIGLLRSKLLPMMVRVDKDKMREAMDKELGPELRKEYGKDITLLGARIKRPWPVLQKNAAGKYEAKFRPEDEEFLIYRDDNAYSDYWDAHDSAVRYLHENANLKNPLAAFVILQQVADDPSLMLPHISPEHPEVRAQFEKFNDRNADGTFKYKNPKRERMLDAVRKHVADPKNGKIIVFSQSTMVLDKIQDWLYSDPEIRKHLGLGEKAFKDTLVTRKYNSTPGLVRYTGGMKSGMVKQDAAAILKRVTAGDANEVETEAVKKERAFVRHAFQNDPSTKILLASDAAQTGLTLTAANLVINYNLGWNPKAMDQRIDRAHRIDVAGAKALAAQGGVRDVTALNIIAKGTVDERKMPMLAWKDHMFDLIVSGQAAVDDTIVSADIGSDADILQQMIDEQLHLKKRRQWESRILERYIDVNRVMKGGFRWL